MIHESLQEELVPVEAGLVADIETGKVHSVWLERHRALLEARVKARQIRERMLNLILALLVFTWPAVAVTAFATEEMAYRLGASALATLP